MFGGVLNESGSSKVLKYRTEKKRLMTVLSLGSCVVSRKIPIHFTEASFSSTVFSCSVWCFALETLQWGRLKNCGSMQSIHYPKLSACEVAGCVKLTREQKPGLCLLAESLLLCSPSSSGLLNPEWDMATLLLFQERLSLMGLTVGVSVRLCACQCPRGCENMQSKSRGAWGNVKAGNKYPSRKRSALLESG